MSKVRWKYPIVALVVLLALVTIERLLDGALGNGSGGVLLFKYLELAVLLAAILYLLSRWLKREYFYVVLIGTLFLIGLELFTGHYGYFREKRKLALTSIFSPSTEVPERFIQLREHKPNYSERISSRANPTKPNVEISTNADGFIEPSGEFGIADVDIVFLGGSTTACIEVDTLSRFPYTVGELLTSKSGLSINSVNAGVTANNSIHSNNNLLNKIVPEFPDHVVMMHNINDLMILLRYGFYWNTKSVLSAIVDSKEGTISNIREVPESNFNVTRQAEIKEHFRNSLTQFVLSCRAWNINPVLMTQFNLFDETMDESLLTREMKFVLKNNFDIFLSLYDSFNDIVRNVAATNKVLLIDLDNEVPKDQKLFYDVVHLSEEGSKLVAQVVSEHLSNYLNSSTEISKNTN